MTNIQRHQFADAVRNLFPLIPLPALAFIVERETHRPGTASLHPLSYAPLALASVAGYVRHKMTGYDALLATGRYTRARAQDRVRAHVQSILAQWRA